MSHDQAKPEQAKLLIAGITILAMCGAVFLYRLHHDKRRFEAISCRSNLISIGLGARMWANEHGETFPGGLSVMSKELNSPKVLFCPATKPFPPGWGSWAVFKDEHSSYAIVEPNIVDGDTNKVFLRCKFHGHLLYGDGSVFDGKKRSGKKSED